MIAKLTRLKSSGQTESSVKIPVKLVVNLLTYSTKSRSAAASTTNPKQRLSLRSPKAYVRKERAAVEVTNNNSSSSRFSFKVNESGGGEI